MTMAAQETREASWLRWAGWCGIAGSVAFVATAVLTSATGGIEQPERPADMVRYVADLADVELAAVLYGAAGIALCALYVPFALGVPAMLRQRTTARLGTTAIVAGLAVLVPAYGIAAASTVGLVNAQEGLGPGGADALFSLHEVLDAAANFFFGAGSFLSLAVGPLLWGLAGRAHSGLPRWLSSLAIVAGLVGIVWLVPPGENAGQTLAILVNVLASIVVFVAISVRLVRNTDELSG